MRDTTLDNENALQHVTCIVVMALCNLPEAFAFDLGDDQSCYLIYKCNEKHIHFFFPLVFHWMQAAPTLNRERSHCLSVVVMFSQ